jgi:hypothetical protein
MTNWWQDAIGFLLGTVLLRYVLLPLVGSALQKLLLRSEGELALYWHNKQHAARLGHAPKSIAECRDDSCRKYR